MIQRLPLLPLPLNRETYIHAWVRVGAAHISGALIVGRLLSLYHSLCLQAVTR